MRRSAHESHSEAVVCSEKIGRQMKVSDFSRYALGICAAAAIPAGCSGGSQAGSVPTLPNSPQQQSASGSRAQNAQPGPPSATIFGPRNSKGITYVAPIGTTTVYGYRRNNRTNQPPVCTVGPFESVNGGIGVDQSGNLWVPDQGANPKTVTEYGPDCGPAKTVLTVSGDTLPDNVAFDTNGHVYVANAVANSGGPGNILQYTGTKVTKTLSDPDISTPQGLAVDKRNNVWVSYRDPGSTGTYVAEFRRGKMPAKLFKNISLGFPGSLEFDRNQNLMGPNGNYSSLDIYAPPYTEKKPTTRLILEDGSVTDPSMCTLGPDQGKLYCTFGFFSLVNVFSYPGGKFLYTYNNGLSGLLPYGIANDPAPRT
jgi:sugar lactone lactonase YvrE